MKVKIQTNKMKQLLIDAGEFILKGIAHIILTLIAVIVFVVVIGSLFLFFMGTICLMGKEKVWYPDGLYYPPFFIGYIIGLVIALLYIINKFDEYRIEKLKWKKS